MLLLVISGLQVINVHHYYISVCVLIIGMLPLDCIFLAEVQMLKYVKNSWRTGIEGRLVQRVSHVQTRVNTVTKRRIL